MRNHDSACEDSSNLCNYLFESLKNKIANLERGGGVNWCSFRSTGKAFAWIKHSKREKWIRIWFLGSVDEAKQFPALTIEPRLSPDPAGGWADFGGSFKICDDLELNKAVKLLTMVSHPQSIR